MLSVTNLLCAYFDGGHDDRIPNNIAKLNLNFAAAKSLSTKHLKFTTNCSSNDEHQSPILIS